MYNSKSIFEFCYFVIRGNFAIKFPITILISQLIHFFKTLNNIKMKKLIYTLALVLIVHCTFNIENCMSQWQADVRLTNNPAFSGTNWNNAWCITANSNIVHVLYSDNRDGNLEIYYKRSTDAGISWGADTRVTNSIDSSVKPSVAFSGSVLHIVWQDKRDGIFNIYYKRSTDAGLSWGTDSRLSNNIYASFNPSLSVSGLNVNAVWDIQNGIYFKRSTDGGVSWGADVIFASGADAHTPSICVSGTILHVVWVQQEGLGYGYDIYYKRSTDNGINWGTNTLLTNTSSSLWDPPSIAVSGSIVHVVYSVYNISKWDIYYKRSTNGGTSWTGDTDLVNSTASAINPSLAVSGSAVHIAWFDARNTNMQIYYKRSTNGGNAWETDTRLTNTDSNSVVPSIATAGSIVHIVWFDNRDGNYEIYYKRNPTGNPIGIQNISSEIPDKFKLEQNYPNPFNPTTKIKFDVVRLGNVKIVVYDVMGREVQTLVNESLKPGTYEASFDGSSLNSGVYFYKISAGEFSQTKKMLMIK